MKQLNYKGNDGIDWEIIINYDNTQDVENTGKEVVLVKSNETSLQFTYPFQPVLLKFKIEPTKTNIDGTISYGCLKYDDEIVCSFDPEL